MVDRAEGQAGARRRLRRGGRAVEDRAAEDRAGEDGGWRAGRRPGGADRAGRTGRGGPGGGGSQAAEVRVAEEVRLAGVAQEPSLVNG